MYSLKDLSESVIFQKGQKIADEHFIGTAWVETLVPMDSTFNCQDNVRGMRFSHIPDLKENQTLPLNILTT